MFLSFIHTNTSCATLQEKLHESDWWFIASSVRSFVTIAYHTWISPAISKWVSLPLIILIACGLPQLVLVLSVTCRQLKGKQMAQYIAGKVSTLLKQIRKWKQGNELSDADSWPHSVVSPNQYNRSLLPDTGQTHNNSETLTVRGQVPPVNNYGSVN